MMSPVDLLLNPRHRDLVLTNVGLRTSIAYGFKEYEYICLLDGVAQ